MPALAYLFLECIPGRPKGVLDELKRIPGVRGGHIVTGEFDIIAIREAADVKALGEIVLSRVQSFPGLHKTTTNLRVE